MLNFLIFYGVIIFTISMLCFIASLKNYIKNDKFDFIKMFKNFFITLSIDFLGIFFGYVMLKILT